MKLIKNIHGSRRNFGVVALMVGALGFAVMCQPAAADNVHFNCLDGATCGAAATVTDSTDPPNFQLQWTGSGNSPQSGDLIVVFLVPEADGTLSSPISITGTGMNGPVSATATLYSATAWTNNNQKLDAYLSTILSGGASPANPLSNYGPSYIYDADLGTQTLCQNGTGCTQELDLTSSALPNDTYILAFLGVTTSSTKKGVTTYSTSWYGTPNSETYLETGTPPPPSSTPEPSSLALLGTGVLGLAGAVRRRFCK